MKKEFLKLYYNNHYLAYKQFKCKSNNNIVFLGGYNSDMSGSKASYLDEFCRNKNINYTRFDYFGHGLSSGDLLSGSISLWLDNVVMVMEELVKTPSIIVGSSMGGWLAFLLALAKPDLVQAVVGMAAAPDFTEKLVWENISSKQKENLLQTGILHYGEEQCGENFLFSKLLIEDGRKHLLLDNDIAITKPVTLIHGIKDVDVPYEFALQTQERLISQDVTLMLKKDGDHRLSRPEDLEILALALENILKKVA